MMGGLGNQMFQYAFAKHLAVKQGVELKMDLSHFKRELNKDKFTVRDLGLSHFNTNPVIASEAELKRYEKSKFSKIIDLFCLNLPFKLNHLYVREPFFRFYKKALNAPKDCYLDGYWQSEYYFREIRKELLNDFTLVSELSDETMHVAEKIKSQQSVSIHVRRGDYISIAENQTIYSICDEQYYLTAMNRMADINKDSVFYVFSDEPEWFKTKVHSKYNVQYVMHNVGKNSYQDLYLMSLCKHNIIANSSFSWWAAWLNKNIEKMVIAPKNWFKNRSKDTSDLIPKAWIQL